MHHFRSGFTVLDCQQLVVPFYALFWDLEHLYAPCHQDSDGQSSTPPLSYHRCEITSERKVEEAVTRYVRPKV